MAFKLPTLRDIPRQITSDLPSFDFDDIKNEISILGKEATVLCTKPLIKNNGCHKKIASESSEDENLNVHNIKTSCWLIQYLV